MSRSLEILSGVSVVISPVTEDSDFTLAFHRGGGKSHPENTLDTFLWAWNLGAIPEGDVQYTRDGVAVMFHDPDLSRIPWALPESMKTRRIADLEWQVLRTLDVGTYCGDAFSPQRIPTLRSVFAAMEGLPERRLYLDEKGLSLDNQREIASLAWSHSVADQLYFTSGSYDRIRAWSEICPEAHTMLWLGYCWTADGMCDMTGLTRELDTLRSADFEGITHLNVHITADFSRPEPLSPGGGYLKALAEEMRARGLPFQVISLTEGENPALYRHLLDLGINGISTDYPEVTLGVLRSRGIVPRNTLPHG